MKSNQVSLNSLKLFVVVIILSMFMVGCGIPNPIRARQNVIESMETLEVISMPRDPFSFIVRAKDGAIWFVETCGDKVNCKAILLPPTNVNTPINVNTNK